MLASAVRVFIFAIQYRLIVRSTRSSATDSCAFFCDIFYFFHCHCVNYIITYRFRSSLIQPKRFLVLILLSLENHRFVIGIWGKFWKLIEFSLIWTQTEKPIDIFNAENSQQLNGINDLSGQWSDTVFFHLKFWNRHPETIKSYLSWHNYCSSTRFSH